MSEHDHPETRGFFEELRPPMGRRAFLRLLSGTAGMAALAGCGGGAYALLPKSDPSNALSSGLLKVHSRAEWGASGGCRTRLNRMNGVKRITVHHEGTPGGTWTADSKEIASLLRRIQRFQMSRRRMGDIAYHYIVDRAGRVWAGRPLAWQGAHVRDNNEHNIGVMVMGNFDLQEPTRTQILSLERLLRVLRDRHRVPSWRLHTHRELTASRCPGRNLQPEIESLRRRLA